jgi:hypothetical protein
MTMLAAKIPNSEIARPQTAPAMRHSSKIVSPATAFPFSIQRKSSCACGGGCPRCGEEESKQGHRTAIRPSSPLVRPATSMNRKPIALPIRSLAFRVP